MKRLLSIILALSVLFVGFCVQNPAVDHSGPSLAFTADTTIPNLEDLAGVPESDDEFILWDASTSLTKKVSYSYLNYLRNADEYGGLTAAVAAIGATEQTLLINTEQTIADDLTIPATMSLVVVKGGSMAVANTKTLTINGSILASGYQIFSGTGTVVYSGTGIFYDNWKPGGANTFSLDSLTASVPLFTDASKNLTSSGTVSALVDVQQASDEGIATNDTLALTFAFVPSKIVIDYSMRTSHDTSFQTGHSTGHCVVLITGVDTKTNNLNVTFGRAGSALTFIVEHVFADTTNILYGKGGYDGTDFCIVVATGAWVTATKTLTLTFTVTNSDAANNDVELIATAYR